MLLPVSSRAVPADQGGAELSVGEQQGRDAGPRPGGDIQLKVRLVRCGSSRVSHTLPTHFETRHVMLSGRCQVDVVLMLSGTPVCRNRSLPSSSSSSGKEE